MNTPILLIVAAGAGVLILIRLLTGGRSTDQSKREAEKNSISSMNKIKAYEQQVEQINRKIRTSPDKQRELLAKKMELLLKQKERLKKTTERMVKKS